MFAGKFLSNHQGLCGNTAHLKCQLPQALAEGGKMIQLFLLRLKAAIRSRFMPPCSIDVVGHQSKI
jgi:hypothetical protein